jgi:ubiquinone/menaquinone biosynthesis C-methylase UbiE
MFILKPLMKLDENHPTFDLWKSGAVFHESWDHPDFLKLDDAKRHEVALSWANELYEAEVRRPLDRFFSADLATFCKDKRMLDLGCYLAGRSVRWYEKYQVKELYGVDVEERFLDVARAFAKQKSANARFSIGFGEDLQFEDGFFDVIMSKDTFEHVWDIQKTLQQCHRVLKRGGYMILAFPPFHSNHHLDLVTRVPYVHWFFSYRDILRAYFSILDERGEAATWYRRKEEEPLPHEKGYTLNGTTAAQFKRLIAKDWQVVYDGFKQHRSKSKNPAARFVINAIKQTDFPFVREIVNAIYILQKP